MPPRQTFDGSRRALLAALPAIVCLTATRRAAAVSLSDFTTRDAAAALRGALEQGAEAAVKLLGRTDGFWGDVRVRIPLPEWLEQVEPTLRLFGRGREIDELRLNVNRAAEQAVPEARALLVSAVRTITVEDARGILTGGDDSVTQFFAGKTRTPLTTKFLPIVGRVTERIGLARRYNRIATQAESLGLLETEQARIERFVTAKALDGLYFMIGEEEKKIRSDPVAATRDIVRKVFGTLQ
ncbi:MAG TPA: DUF4197 domain-containing protein [Burkholderiaceae bacterium]|nr:DUF4197 domain-containing protein [Burkholderiaceae bacterium]